jgi:arylsulfatase
MPFSMSIDETLDIGSDTRTPVDDNDYQIPFHFTGRIDKVTFKLGPQQLTDDDQKAKEQVIANMNN